MLTHNIQATRIVVRPDALGRVIFPGALREALGLGSGQKVNVWGNEEEIRIEAQEDTEPHCEFCGTAADLAPFKGKHVCIACKVKLGELLLAEAG